MAEQTTDAFSEQLLDIFRRKVKKKYRDAVRPDARLQADLGMDSLGVLSAMLIAEEELGISIFPLQADVGEIRTVGNIIDILRAIKEKASGS